MRSLEHGSLVYVSDVANSTIGIFDRNGDPVAVMTHHLKYPAGLFVDAAHHLWVANEGSSTIEEFSRGGGSLLTTLPDGSDNPEDVTICPDGTIYVANIVNGIAVYSGPKHKRSRTLDYDAAAFTFITCDAAGNVFATGVVGTNGTVIEFPGGSSSGAKLLPISSAGNLGGIKPDNAGNLLVEIDGSVTEYTEAGYATGNAIETNGQWEDIALDRDGKVLLGADQTHDEGIAVSFPRGNARATYRHGFNTVLGVAFDPGQSGI